MDSATGTSVLFLVVAVGAKVSEVDKWSEEGGLSQQLVAKI